MRIAVYTIAKNEELNCAQWLDTTRLADLRVVGDTGSRDRTRELLSAQGVHVVDAKIEPWRFDEARNFVLDRLPTDIDVCVSLDMDESLSDGWREAIEAAWTPGTTQLRYRDIRELNNDGTAARCIHGFKIHSRHGYRWKYAIHEVLVPFGREEVRFCDSLEITHRTDPRRRRDQYDSLLERMIHEEPHEAHYRYYWALRRVGHADYLGALDALQTFLNRYPEMDRLWRSNAWRLSAWCRDRLGKDRFEVFSDLLRSAIECPDQREVWVHLSAISGENSQWRLAEYFASRALQCTDPSRSLIIDPMAWNGRPEQMLRSAAMRAGQQLHSEESKRWDEAARNTLGRYL